MPSLPQFATTLGLLILPLVIAADVNNVIVRTLVGNPTVGADVRVTNNAGINIGSTSTATPALDWGTGWNPIGTYSCTNLGSIEGKGGVGGNGGVLSSTQATNGLPGGDAIWQRGLIVSYNNDAGNIWGGGGGGGGGPWRDSTGKGDAGSSGPGGGGGAGNQVGTGGSSGGSGANNGSNGSATAGGSQGGGSDPLLGPGGNGGGPGAAGSPGTHSPTPGFDHTIGLGGAAGRAILLGGGTANFTSGTGNNSTHVKGAVS